VRNYTTKLLNYSAEYSNLLYSWLPHDLSAEVVVFLPDACPGKSPLPTGTVVKTKQSNWRKFAVSDCGCGMLLGKSLVKTQDFDRALWDQIYKDLKANRGKLGDLGSGNHFLNAYESYSNDLIYFLIHTGSREESVFVEPLVDSPERFDAEFIRVCKWAEENRLSIAAMLEKRFGTLDIVMDRNHNSFEMLQDNYVIIRKGAVKLMPGEVTIIPSNMADDAVVVRATGEIESTLHSMSHGTGRIMSRSQAKAHAESYDYETLRDRIYIPDEISNHSIKTEAPFCYRDLDSCLKLIDNLVVEVERFSPFAYIGHV